MRGAPHQCSNEDVSQPGAGASWNRKHFLTRVALPIHSMRTGSYSGVSAAVETLPLTLRDTCYVFYFFCVFVIFPFLLFLHQAYLEVTNLVNGGIMSEAMVHTSWCLLWAPSLKNHTGSGLVQASHYISLCQKEDGGFQRFHGTSTKQLLWSWYTNHSVGLYWYGEK